MRLFLVIAAASDTESGGTSIALLTAAKGTTMPHFMSGPEWDSAGQCPLVRFRPHRPPVLETILATLPTAHFLGTRAVGLAAVGRALFPAMVLVECRLRTPGRDRAVDLLVLGRSGRIAVGECKRVTRGVQAAYRLTDTRAAHHARLIRRFAKDPAWLPAQIEASYARCGFPAMSAALVDLGITRRHQGEWWKGLARRCRTEPIPTFVVLWTRQSQGPVVITVVPSATADIHEVFAREHPPGRLMRLHP